MSIVWYKVLPAHFGGQKGIANFNEALGKHFPLYCVCSRNNEPGGAHSYQVFNWLPVSKWQFINPLVIIKLMLFAINNKITHVILEHPYHAVAAMLLKISGRKIICHSHNIEYKRGQLTGKRYSNIIKYAERFVYKMADVVLMKTKEDILFVQDVWKVKGDKIMLMPYCITPEPVADKSLARLQVQQRHNISAENKILLFNGTLDYAPNADAVINIKKHLVHALRHLQIPFTIIITGRLIDKSYAFLETLRAREVVMAGHVEDVQTYFAAADVYLNAVNEGEGVQTKTLEALSHHLPVVMFAHMHKGIEARLTPAHLYFAKQHDWKMFASLVIEALSASITPVPNEFFQHYSFDRHLPPLIQYINKS